MYLHFFFLHIGPPVGDWHWQDIALDSDQLQAIADLHDCGSRVVGIYQMVAGYYSAAVGNIYSMHDY